MDTRASLYAFHDVEVNEALGEVRREGRPVEIHAKPLRLLLYLLQHRERIVSKQELLDRVWPDVVVSDGALSAALREVRQVVGDDGREQRVIQTRRGRGYRVVAPVEERAATAPRLTVAADFVGRDDALAELSHALEGALAGRARIVLLSGEGGIGKTRTAEELAREARERGVPVYSAWCQQGSDALSYWPWAQVLSGLAAEHANELPPALARLLPESRAVEEAVPALEPGEARFCLFDAVASFLRSAASERGLVLVLDDLQWADASSLALLEFLAREVGATRLLMVATLRDVAAQAKPALARCLATLSRSDACTRIRLEGLAPVEVGALLEALEGEVSPDELVDEVHTRTDGNPFFVRELAAHARAGHQGRVPPGVSELIRGRLCALSNDCREVLAVASALGSEFASDLLAEVTGLQADRLASLLDEARRAELVCETPAGSHRFVHALVCEAVQAEQPAPERMRIHRRVAEVLESLARAEPGPRLSELARHFEAAGDPGKAARYAQRAGERALRLPAFEAAAGHFEHALQLAEGRAAPELERRCDLLLALGQARAAEGQAELQRAAYRRAGALARELGDGARLAEAATRFVVGNFTDTEDPEGARLLEAALETLGTADSSDRAKVLARLAFTRLALGDSVQANALAREAAACAVRVGEPGAQGLVAAIDGAMGLQLGSRPEAVLESFQRALGFGDAAGDTRLVRATRAWTLQPLLILGDRERADAAVAMLREWAPWDATAATFVALHASHRALLAGRLAEADAHVDAALSRSQGLEMVVLPLAQRYQIRREQGRLGEMEPLLEQLMRQQPRLALLRAHRAHLLGEVGRNDEAQAELTRLASDEFAGLANLQACLVMLAETTAALGDAERARPLYASLLPWAPYHALLGPLGSFWGPVARALGVLATVLGRWGDAERHFDEALALCRRMDAPLWELRTGHDRARMLLARDGAGDHEAAGELAEAALASARRLGLVALAESLEGLRSELAGAIPLRGRRRRPVSA